jgi:hypothetical protein
VFKGCALIKHVKVAFPSNEHKSREILDLIHSNMCGAMSSTSLSSNIYYVSFIDDYSRKSLIYFIKTKDGVFGKFQEFKALVENQTRKKIKVFSDNGGEYTSKEFNIFCRQAGIKEELTVPYNPQQDGIAERKNRSIIETAKSMIRDLDLPMCLWAEACLTVVYILNKCPHRVLKDKTSKEAFTGEKPQVAHLCVFGCPVYIHILDEKGTKLKPSGLKGIFVGYSETSKAYRVYIPSQRKVIVSRYVKFDKDDGPPSLEDL